ncbi:uncharacterized protein LOC135374650 [Ornithodoros turicata]|uniref:uncharacterized protein LOC135374650 n=1 Tax=Ornithodoros turicata TaxID=34597 RepID=UPI003139DA00
MGKQDATSFQSCFKRVPKLHGFRLHAHDRALDLLLLKYPHLVDTIGTGGNMDNLGIEGENGTTIQQHQEWLLTSAPEETDHYKESMVVTAKARQEHIKSLTVQEALNIYPFLKSQTIVVALLEFEIQRGNWLCQSRVG